MIRIVCFSFCFKIQTILLELNWREKGCPIESFYRATKPYSKANEANHMDETSE